MNLLADPWLPVMHDKQFDRVSLQEILCTDTDFQIALPRDDMELAALQLLICLTQALFPVRDQSELLSRLRSPLDVSEYADATKRYLDWFDLDHPRTPFMQTRGPKSHTPVQKLFVGLPEGNNHCFFNAEGEIRGVCGGCAAIALFNQATNCPSFGGGFKPGLRGSAPVTTLVDGPTLRRRVWENVLPITEIRQLLPEVDCASEHRPVWVDAIPTDSLVSAASIGLLRGLFWQPAKVELIPSGPATCDHCGGPTERSYSGFYKDKFSYQLEGVWPHPHSPRQWEAKKGARHVRFLSFFTTEPAWTQLTQFLVSRQEDEEGHVPAPVVSSRRQRRTGGRLHLLVGGYRNNQANIVERRHELFSFAPGWEDGDHQLADVVYLGLRIAKLLRASLYLTVKGQKNGYKGIGVSLHGPAERAFYHRTEDIIHAALRDIEYQHYQRLRTSLLDCLGAIAKVLYDQAVSPYIHDSEFVHAIAAGRLRLNKGLRALKEEKNA